MRTGTRRGSGVYGSAFLMVLWALAQMVHARQVTVTETAILRTGPSPDARAVAKAPPGTSLWAVKDAGRDWAEVSPPQALNVWILGSLVRDNTVAVPSVFVRTGPGVDYAPVGTVRKGLRLTVHDRKDGWLRIDPPSQCTLFVESGKLRRGGAGAGPAAATPSPPRARRPVPSPDSGDGEQLPPPAPVGSVGAARSAPQPQRGNAVTARRGEPQASASARPRRRGRGPTVEKVGVVRPVGALVLRRPSRYRLVKPDPHGRAHTICYLVGDEQRLARAVGYRVRVSGWMYDLFAVRYDAMLIDRLAAP